MIDVDTGGDFAVSIDLKAFEDGFMFESSLKRTTPASRSALAQICALPFPVPHEFPT